MISITNLSKSYDGVRALRNVTLEIPRGEFFGLIGANGAGKSTLLKSIIGLVRPDNGEIKITDYSTEEDLLSIKRLVGYAPEEPILYDYLTGREYLEFVGSLREMDGQVAANRIEELMSVYELSEKASQLIAEYSHGMRKKISLCAALLDQPQILLLDEPTNGLDPESVFQLKKQLQAGSERGVTVIFSSHILDTVEKVCHRIGIIHEGRIIACGSLAELRTQHGEELSLEEIFMRLVEKE
jgi:ABC-2 type transport system ATP-binding protein